MKQWGEKSKQPKKKLVQCEKCTKEISRWYTVRNREWGHYHEQDYWTELEQDQGKFLCQKCLTDLYHDKEALNRIIISQEKKKRLGNLINQWARLKDKEDKAINHERK